MVAQDEREGGLRRILNFGHTLGHGLEQASGFRLPHGRAVAWGMMAALTLSERLAGLDRAEAEWGRGLIRDFDLCRPLPELNPADVMAALSLDKKRQETGVPFVLLPRLGETVITRWGGLGAGGRGVERDDWRRLTAGCASLSRPTGYVCTPPGLWARGWGRGERSAPRNI